MGYAFYTLSDGREAGYGVEDVCNLEGCDEEINRGLAYLCGQTPGGDEWGCGGYFCGNHRYLPPLEGPSVCSECLAKLGQEEDEEAI